MSSERLQKILARAGVGSRRAAERVIAEGRVRLNGRIVKELGTRADTHRDRVEVDGKRLVAEHPVYYLLHKPREVITTLADPEQRESVAQLMKDVRERVFPVGRLDYHTSGALLMTNDGELTQALLHPRKNVPKVYVAKFRGELSLSQLQTLREGVLLDGGETTRKAEVFVTRVERGNTWLQLTITEGKNRQIHRMGEAIGRRVMRLFRLSFAGLSVDGLRAGEHRQLSDSELAKLKRDYLNPSQRDKAERAKARRREMVAAGVGEGEDAQVETSAPRQDVAKHGPAKPVFAKRGPSKRQDSAKHTPAKPNFAKTGPVKWQDFSKHGPVKRDFAKRGSAKRDFAKRGPAKPDFAKRGPAKPDFAKRDPTKWQRAESDPTLTTGTRRTAKWERSATDETRRDVTKASSYPARRRSRTRPQKRRRSETG
jgi:23S rRNA pseudouridine2605 synthase